MVESEGYYTKGVDLIPERDLHQSKHSIDTQACVSNLLSYTRPNP